MPAVTPRAGIICHCGRRILAGDVRDQSPHNRPDGRRFVYVKFRCPDCGRLGEQFIKAEDWSEDLLPEIAPMEFEPGDLLRLPKPIGSLTAGWYVLLSIVDAQSLLCHAEREEDGGVYATDRLQTTNVYNLAFFRPTGFRLEMSA